MLKLHFINVSDGDSILLESFHEGGVYRVLIDTGRPELPPCEGSLRTTAADYLAGLGITEIDTLIITHLHIDHFGALSQLAERFRFGRVYAACFPPEGAGAVTADPGDVKSVRGMIEALNLWKDGVRALQSKGTALCAVDDEILLTVSGGVSLKLFPRKACWAELQDSVWSRMYTGIPCEAEEKYRASKSRNPGSLRVLVSCFGKTVMLGGDCYGEEWDSEPLTPCDILKIPHHGDAKAATPLLAEKLRPRYAVVSCGAEYLPHKDRPSGVCARWFTGLGAKLYLTDSFEGDWYAPNYWQACVFMIREDGEIIPPAPSGFKM